MNIIIKAKNCELTPSLKEYIEEKIGSLEKYSRVFEEKKNAMSEKGSAKVEALVEIGRSTLHHRKGDLFEVEVHLNFPRHTLTAKAAAEDFKMSINDVREGLQRQITDFKDKMIERSREA